MTQPAPLEPQSLYERIGGFETVDAIVEAFYRRVVTVPELRALYPEDLEPGKEKLKLFFVQWLGGPPRYSELYGHPRLRRRHFPFVIDDRGVGRWLRNMRLAWHDAGVDQETQMEVFKNLGPLAKHMMNAGENVPREPLGDVRMQ